MRQGSVVALLLCTLLACQGGEGDGGGYVCFLCSDAAPLPDVDAGRCSPVTQTGCEVGQKCGLLIASDDPFLAAMVCVPDGTVPVGGLCAWGQTGPNGYSNCAAGLHCHTTGTCQKFCNLDAPELCATRPLETCQPTDDRPPGPEVGLCLRER